jgi:hypothetical protein
MSALAKAPHWIDLAEQRAESSHNPKIYIGAGLAGALVAGTILNPITAALAAIWGLYAAWEANEAVSDQMEAVEDGLIAHLLDRRQLKQYLAEFGKDQVQMELQLAIARELPLSDAATEAAKRLNLDTTGKSVDRLPGLPPAPQPTGAIGAMTRLRAITVKAQPVAESPSPDNLPRAPIQIDQDCPHFLLLAGSREGKSNALRCLLDNAERVHYVSSKATDSVPQHWQGYLVQGDSDTRVAQVMWLLQEWGRRLAAHAADPSLLPEWFVVDEAIQILNYAKRGGKKLAEAWCDMLIEIATQGAAIGCYGVVLAQTKNAGPLGIDLDLIQQNFRIVVPVKQKRRLALTVLEKIAGLRLTQAQQEEVLTFPGEYLQLWVGGDEQVYFDVLPCYQGALKALERCPELSADGDDTTIIVSAQRMEKSPEEKVIDWLNNNPGWHTVAAIKKSVRPLPDWQKSAVQNMLMALWENGRIDASDDKYAATGTSPE